MTDEALDETTKLISTVGLEVQVSKERYEEFFRALDDGFQVSRPGAEGSTRKFADCDAEVKERKLYV